MEVASNLSKIMSIYNTEFFFEICSFLSLNFYTLGNFYHFFKTHFRQSFTNHHISLVVLASCFFITPHFTGSKSTKNVHTSFGAFITISEVDLVERVGR